MNRTNFSELNSGESFYLMSHLMMLHVNRCTKESEHTYRDRGGKLHVMIFTDSQVYGPLALNKRDSHLTA